MLSHYFTKIDRRTVRYFKEKLQQLINLIYTRGSKRLKPMKWGKPSDTTNQNKSH